MFFFFAEAMLLFAFFVGTLVNTQRVAYTASYAFVLLAVLLEIILSNITLVYFLFFNKRSSLWISFIKVLFYLYPPFAYSILYGVISRVASTHYDDESLRWVPAREYYWSDLTKSAAGEFSNGDMFNAPTPLHCFGMLLLDMLIYVVATWYFDHVIASNRGHSE